MDTLFLIAHKVRGEPAFDVAMQMRCPVCEPMRQGLDDGSAPLGCDACEGEGHWWIIPTSGHRARPYWSMDLGALMHDTEQSANLIVPERTLDTIPTMPPDLPDHYPLADHDITNYAPAPSGALGGLLAKFKKPPVKVDRRI